MIHRSTIIEMIFISSVFNDLTFMYSHYSLQLAGLKHGGSNSALTLKLA